MTGAFVALTLFIVAVLLAMGTMFGIMYNKDRAREELGRNCILFIAHGMVLFGLHLLYWFHVFPAYPLIVAGAIISIGFAGYFRLRVLRGKPAAPQSGASRK